MDPLFLLLLNIEKIGEALTAVNKVDIPYSIIILK